MERTLTRANAATDTNHGQVALAHPRVKLGAIVAVKSSLGACALHASCCRRRCALEKL